MRLGDSLALAGSVTVTLRDRDGRIVARRRLPNTVRDAFAHNLAPLLAGLASPVPLTLSHIGLGASGVTVERCEDVAGWTGTPVLDTTTFREGAASFRRNVAASGSALMASPARTLDLTGATHVELWLRVDVRARLAPATPCLRLVTSGGNLFAINWDTIEQLRGGALVDGQWTRVTPAVAAFAATGSPSWANITGVEFGVAASAAGAVTAWWDGVLALTPIDASATASVVPNETTRLALSALESLGSGRTRARVSWSTRAAVGVHRVAGLYANSGATLAAIVELRPPIEKSDLLSLTVEWTVTTAGG